MEIKRNIILEGKHGKPILLDIFYETTTNPTSIIIFSHGFKGFKDWGPFNLMAEKFAEAGFIFIKFNFSYNGTTPEHPDEFGDLESFGNNNLLIELDDLSSVIDFASSKNFYEQFSIHHSPFPQDSASTIHLMGHSRGGGITILTGAKDERVNKIITLGSVNRFGSFFNSEMISEWQRDGVRYELNSRTGQKMPMYYQYWETIERNRDKLDIPSSVENLSKPMLIIHGREDETVSFQNAVEMHGWNKPMTQLLIIDNANHTFNGKYPWNEMNLPAALSLAIEKSVQFLKTSSA